MNGDIGLIWPEVFDVSVATPLSGGHEWSPLATMRAPFARLGRCAVDMLDAMIKEQRMDGDGLVLPSRLVKGSTTAPPASAAAAEEDLDSTSFALSR